MKLSQLFWRLMNNLLCIFEYQCNTRLVSEVIYISKLMNPTMLTVLVSSKLSTIPVTNSFITI